MSKKSPVRFMIMDACVLIDYMNGDPDLFKLISTHVGALYVATPILKEGSYTYCFRYSQIQSKAYQSEGT